MTRLDTQWAFLPVLSIVLEVFLVIRAGGPSSRSRNVSAGVVENWTLRSEGLDANAFSVMTTPAVRFGETGLLTAGCTSVMGSVLSVPRRLLS